MWYASKALPTCPQRPMEDFLNCATFLPAAEGMAPIIFPAGGPPHSHNRPAKSAQFSSLAGCVIYKGYSLNTDDTDGRC
jgi:hypothetical protein